VVVYNAHYGGLHGVALSERNEQCIAALQRLPLAASTIFFVQEAGSYLEKIAKIAFKSHVVSYKPPADGRMALLTLVPRALVTLEGAYVNMHDIQSSSMARQYHAVCVRDLVLVNTHLESCARNHEVRSAQVSEINAMYGGGSEYRLGIFGDLNGYNHWVSHIPGRTAVRIVETRKEASISPHTLLILSVE
jgi:hypothetical protein